MLRSFRFAAATVLALSFASAASAATIGAEVGLSSISPCPSFCGGGGGSSDFAFDGGEGESFASQTLSNAQGNGEATAEFVGGLFPHLAALSNSNPNARIGASATAYRLYTYSGPSATISLDIMLTGEASAPAANDASIRGIVAMVFGTDLPHSTDPGTFLFEILPGEPGLEQCGDTIDISLAVNAGPQAQGGSISCDVEDGDQFFIWANLATSGTRGGVADALADSLDVTWTETGITAVPEPSLVGLMLVGGLALAAHRGNRR